MRMDLLKRFKQRQRKLREKGFKQRLETRKQCVPVEHGRDKGEGEHQKEQIVDYFITPLTSHGTRKDVVASIVQYGVLKPGASCYRYSFAGRMWEYVRSRYLHISRP